MLIIMVSFKKFMVVWCATIIAVSAFAVGAGTLPNRPSTAKEKEGAHFSVHWMGFIPEYSNQYPEYYACINDLLSDTLYFPIALKLVNQENSSFYFRVVQNQTSPAGWTLATNTLGLINKDETRLFTYSAFRTKPASIPEGRLTETISLAVQAYYDSLYTQFYSEDSFAVTYNFLDRTAGAWVTLDIDNFDDGTTHDWGGYICGVTSELYRSFPYSFSSGDNVHKSFTIPDSFSEAYLLCAIRFPPSSQGRYDVLLNGVKCFQSDVDIAPFTWYQVAIPLPTNQTTEVRFMFYYSWSGYVDDAYVVAK